MSASFSVWSRSVVDEIISFAGIHPPAATMSMLFWNLLHHPEVMERATAEISQRLPPMTADRPAYSSSDVEQHLPYFRSCVKESFRNTPVFTMPLERRVVDDSTFLNGRKIPKGVSGFPFPLLSHGS